MTVRSARPALIAVTALVALVLGLLPGVASAAPDRARPVLATKLTLKGTKAFAGNPTRLTARLTGRGGNPLPGMTVRLQRRQGGEWVTIATPTTDANGVAHGRAPMRFQSGRNVFRAVFRGAGRHDRAFSGEVRVPLRKRAGVLGIAGPHQVEDGKSVRLRFHYRTGQGNPIAGRVRVQRLRGGKWRTIKRLRLGKDGRGAMRVGPRSDSTYRARTAGADWVTGDVTGKHFVDNLPPGKPVRLGNAPRPEVKLPKQPPAVGKGPNARISRIPNKIWRDMVGISWRRGCPVGRAGLRLVRVNYWAYDGYRRRGEIVVASGAAGKTARAFSGMYRQGFPIRSMYRIDRFGYSRRVNGGNDHRSMRAGNTSGFNCRSVVNNPGVRSPHSYGRAIDINTWENPYHSRTGWVPNRWWAHRSHPRVAWRSGDHPVVGILRNAGFAWTYGVEDSQHFDARTASGAVLMPQGCKSLPFACH